MARYPWRNVRRKFRPRWRRRRIPTVPVPSGPTSVVPPVRTAPFSILGSIVRPARNTRSIVRTPRNTSAIVRIPRNTGSRIATRFFPRFSFYFLLFFRGANPFPLRRRHFSLVGTFWPERRGRKNRVRYSRNLIIKPVIDRGVFPGIWRHARFFARRLLLQTMSLKKRFGR